VAPAAWWVAERVAQWPDEPHVELAPRVLIEVDKGDWISANVYRSLYERPELSLLPRLIRTGTVVVDVGANRGLYTVMASSLVGSDGQVIALEPSARCLPMLRKVIAKQPLDNVTLVEVALTESEGVATLHDTIEGHAGLGTLRDAGPRFGEAQQVRTQRFDDLVELDGVDLIELVKIDVEGLEPAVLAGARQSLTERRIGALLIEVSPQLGTAEGIDAFLRELEGYQAFAIGERGLLRRRTSLHPIRPGEASYLGHQYNLLVLREDRLATVAPFITGAK
jgi:FkbM family methyltransferase